MKPEYDFSHGERGKFYRPDSKLKIPVYLDEDVLSSLNERADSRGIETSELVNEILKKELELSRMAK
jgi:hypothetical protein